MMTLATRQPYLYAFAVCIIIAIVAAICQCRERPRQNKKKVVVCFLTRQLNETYAQTVDLLVRDIPWMSAYVIVDEDTALPVPLLHAKKVFVPEQECRDKFYTHINWFKPVCAWGKCLYALNYIIPVAVDFQHAWIIEDDCAFASTALFRSVVENYRSLTADLIATHIETQSKSEGWSNWHYANAYFTKTPRNQLYKSFNVLMRISKPLLQACDAAIQVHGRAAFLEVFFINVCVQSKLVFKNADELQPHLHAEDKRSQDTRVAPVYHPSKNMLENLLQLR